MTNVLPLPENLKSLGLDTSIYGIGFSLIIFVVGSLAVPDNQEQSIILPPTADIIQEIGGAVIQYGDLSQRVYLMKIKDAQPDEVVEKIENIAQENDFTKIFAKVAESNLEPFEESGFRKEAFVPKFYQGRENAYFVAKYLDEDRKIEDLDYDQVMKTTILKTAQAAASNENNQVDAEIRICKPDDAEQMAQIYQDVFPTYPFPIHDPDYLKETMEDHIQYFCAEQGGEIVALSSAEMDIQAKNAEMTDFATLPDKRGNGFASALLAKMEIAMKKSGMKTLYTIARAISPGMNITFAKAGYSYGGRLVNNTHISNRIESMNVWFKNIDS
jgi:putative beta-lysine N-acetyltransferase